MPSEKLIPSPDTDLFRNRLDNMIDQRHELCRLADFIEWYSFDAMRETGPPMADPGRDETRGR